MTTQLISGLWPRHSNVTGAVGLAVVLILVFPVPAEPQQTLAQAPGSGVVTGLSEVVRLGPENGTSHHPRWSPDGRKLLFSLCPGQYTGTCELWEADAAGANQRPVLKGAFSGAYSPDGRRVAYLRHTGRWNGTRPDAEEIAVYDLAQQREFRLGETGYKIDLWLPNGRQLLLVTFGGFSRTTIRQGPILSSDQRNYSLLDLDKLSLTEVDGHRVWRNNFYTLPMDFTLVQGDPMEEGMPGRPFAAGARLPDGLWAASVDEGYLSFLAPRSYTPLGPRVVDAVLSRDGQRLAWEETGSAYVARLERRELRLYEVTLGISDGIHTGDVFYSKPSRVNPLTGAVVGYLDQPVKGVLVVTRVGAHESLLKPVIEVTGVVAGDVAVQVRPGAWNERVAADVWAQLRAAQSVGEFVRTREAPALLNKILFLSDRDGRFGLYIMNPDGTGVTRLIRESGDYGTADVSPDGTRVAFCNKRDGDWDIYVMNADGSNLRNLTADSPADDLDPAWSPDGNKVAFASMRDGNLEIYTANADGSRVVRLTRNSAHDGEPAWSPDGTRIAFVSVRDRNHEIYVMNGDGTHVTRLTRHPSIEHTPRWSPDGRRIVFSTWRDDNAEIYVMNEDGTGLQRLTNNRASDFNPYWSPDGRTIVFGSDRAGNFEIYAMNADGTGVARLTNHRANDGAPVWSAAR